MTKKGRSSVSAEYVVSLLDRTADFDPDNIGMQHRAASGFYIEVLPLLLGVREVVFCFISSSDTCTRSLGLSAGRANCITGASQWSSLMLQVKAFTYGSVPLKTYLPDGDIDLAIFQNKRSPQQLRETWFIQLSNFLQREEHNPTAYFRVREVHVIHAEVRHDYLLLIAGNSQKDKRTQEQHRILVRGTATGFFHALAPISQQLLQA